EFNPNNASAWVMENVLSQLPHPWKKAENPVWFTREGIKHQVIDFIGTDQNPEFWGYYADYDWVVFCWLFGTMMQLPKHFPMYCRDIKQLCDSVGNPKLPKQGKGEHNALDDARWNKTAYEFLCNLNPRPESKPFVVSYRDGTEEVIKPEGKGAESVHLTADMVAPKSSCPSGDSRPECLHEWKKRHGVWYCNKCPTFQLKNPNEHEKRKEK
ncbi:MAG: hypothetical protein EOM62_17975, partial [Bacteroidia bacterium]|nr:hypothetical protein [Bacteroidia bacterium]